MVKVSVIIPVYNAEKTIERCVRSVLDQEFQDLELIAVDDGSKDASGKILDEIAEKDSRLHVVHVENGGVSRARNIGLSMIQGEYVQFLDADDYIPMESTKLLVRTMEKSQCDLVIADFYRVVGDKVARKGSIRSDALLTLQEFATLMMESPSDFYYGVLWNKLYRSSILLENDLKMDEDLNYCEDFIFNMEYLLHTKTINPLPVPVYYYIKTEGSLVTQSMTLTKVVSTKINVYSYYNNFFRNVLDEKQYRKDRLAIAGYLVNSASDDHAPGFLPGTRKLGNETIRALFKDEESGKSEAFISMSYYMLKLFEKYELNISMKNNVEFRDVQVLSAIYLAGTIHDPKEISDFTGLPQIVVTAVIQHLLITGKIRSELKDRQPEISIVDENDTLITDIRTTFSDVEDVMYSGFSEKERKQMQDMILRVSNNLKTRL